MSFVVSEFFRFVQKKLAHTLFAFKIIIKRFDEFIHCDVLIFEYALLNCFN